MKPLIVTVANQPALPLVWDFLAPSLAKNAPGCEFQLVDIDDHEEHLFGTAGARAFYVSIARAVKALHDDPANAGRLILSLGADTQLHAPVDFEAALGDCDLLTMHDVYTPLCGCVIGMRAGSLASEFYERAIANTGHVHLQFAQTEIAERMDLSLAQIPGAWTTGYIHKVEWPDGRPVKPPRGVTLHHANFVIGMDRKRRILQEVRDAFVN